MDSTKAEDVIEVFGKRIQRCYGCFIAYHLKDMYLGEDVTFYCEHCKDETMFHFDVEDASACFNHIAWVELDDRPSGSCGSLSTAKKWIGPSTKS